MCLSLAQSDCPYLSFCVYVPSICVSTALSSGLTVDGRVKYIARQYRSTRHNGHIQTNSHEISSSNRYYYNNSYSYDKNEAKLIYRKMDGWMHGWMDG